jgi:hypothetical protein
MEWITGVIMNRLKRKLKIKAVTKILYVTSALARKAFALNTYFYNIGMGIDKQLASQVEARKLYKGKYFYEVIDNGQEKALVGPLNNIYYAVKSAVIPGYEDKSDYKFVQVKDGIVVAAFSDKEILVLDKAV